MKVEIRRERDGDAAAVRAVLLAAFETAAEADLVDALRASGTPLVAWVADADGDVVGQILFSGVTLLGAEDGPRIAGLAPMSVVPDWQRQGLGSRLVEAGLEACRGAGYEAVVVLGHPEYYPRFGFEPSVRFGIRSEYDVPDEVFMARELHPGALDGLRGTVRYHEAFAAV